jgi:hypothetical protein
MSRRISLAPVSRRSRILGGALVWTAVGAGLASAGSFWTLHATPTARGAAFVLVVAAVAGVAKGRFLLAPRARANVARILAARELDGVLTLFSPRAWAFAAGMMALGWMLRRSGLPGVALGGTYAAVGAALVVGAIPSWSAWWRMGTFPEGER